MKYYLLIILLGSGLILNQALAEKVGKNSFYDLLLPNHCVFNEDGLSTMGYSCPGKYIFDESKLPDDRSFDSIVTTMEASNLKLVRDENLREGKYYIQPKGKLMSLDLNNSMIESILGVLFSNQMPPAVEDLACLDESRDMDSIKENYMKFFKHEGFIRCELNYFNLKNNIKRESKRKYTIPE